MEIILPELSQKLSNALDESAQESCRAFLGLPCENIELPPSLNNESSVISLIGFTGSIEGNFMLSVSESNACRLVSKMLQEKIEAMNKDVADGISEKINIIAGGVKTRLSDGNFTFNISIPSTMVGNRMLVLSSRSGAQNICRYFNADSIVFSVSLNYKLPKNNKETPQTNQSPKENAAEMLSQLVNANKKVS